MNTPALLTCAGGTPLLGIANPRAPGRSARCSRKLAGGNLLGFGLGLTCLLAIATLFPAVGEAASPLGWTQGTKTALYIRADMEDTPGDPITLAEAQAVMAQACTYFREWSHGHFDLAVTYVPVTLRLPKTNAYYRAQPEPTELRNDMLAAARAYDAGHGSTGLYNPDNYDHDICLFQPVAPVEIWTGTANGGGKGTWINGHKTVEAITHEMGHNWGLSDCFAWQADSMSDPLASGSYSNWKDYFDTMGTPPSWSHYSARGKHYLQWMPDEDALRVTASGTYRLYRHDHADATGTRALVVAPLVDAGSRTYWIEHRVAPLRNYFGLSAAQMAALDDRLQHGVIVDWSSPASINYANDPDRLRYMYAIDMKPHSSSSVAEDSLDGALRIGESFVDPDTAVTFTPLATGGASPHEWIDVRIDFGASGSNHDPVVTVPPGPIMAPVRTDVLLPFTITEPDGDPVFLRWDFGDGLITARQPATTSVRWLVGGTRTIKCYVRDGRGGGRDVSLNLEIADPLLAWQPVGAGLTGDNFYGLAYASGRFVAVGSNATIVTSTDGIDWVRVAAPAGHSYGALASDGAHFMAVGSRYIEGSAQPQACMAYSADGLAWSDVTPVTAIPELYGIVRGDNCYIAVGKGGCIARSTDGSAWSLVASPVTTDLLAVGFGAGRFVAGGLNGKLVTSTDGITWADVSPSAYALFGGIVYREGQWLATGIWEHWTSANGTSWSLASEPRFPPSVVRCAVLPDSDLLLAFANGGTAVSISEDGLVWAGITPPAVAAAGGSIRTAAEGNGVVVIVGSGGRIFSCTNAAGPDTFAAWQNRFFTADEISDPSIGGANADLDADGLGNLLEYALGLHPREPLSPPRSPIAVELVSGEWNVTFQRPAATVDLAYSIERSSDLQTWSPEDVIVERVSAGTMETWRGRCAASSAPRQFFRLRVSVR